MKDEIDRRAALTCMLWAGTGLLWTVSGGVPRSSLLPGSAQAAAGDLAFVQISDSHIGFHNPQIPTRPGRSVQLGNQAAGRFAWARPMPSATIAAPDASRRRQDQGRTAPHALQIPPAAKADHEVGDGVQRDRHEAACTNWAPLRLWPEPTNPG